jgi:hypothetical protein
LKTVNWIHGWLKSIWKSKAVPNYRKDMDKVWKDNALDLGRISAFGRVNKRKINEEYNKIVQEQKTIETNVYGDDEWADPDVEYPSTVVEQPIQSGSKDFTSDE